MIPWLQHSNNLFFPPFFELILNFDDALTFSDQVEQAFFIYWFDILFN